MTFCRSSNISLTNFSVVCTTLTTENEGTNNLPYALKAKRLTSVAIYGHNQKKIDREQQHTLGISWLHTFVWQYIRLYKTVHHISNLVMYGEDGTLHEQHLDLYEHSHQWTGHLLDIEFHYLVGQCSLLWLGLLCCFF